MSDREKDNRSDKKREDLSGQEEKAYRFMDQMVKKRTVSRREVLLRILRLVGAGVAFGLIASLVFTLTQPALREKLAEEKATLSDEDDETEEEAEEAEAELTTSAQEAETESESTPAESESGAGDDIKDDTEEAGESTEQETVPEPQTDDTEKQQPDSAEDSLASTSVSAEESSVLPSVSAEDHSTLSSASAEDSLTLTSASETTGEPEGKEGEGEAGETAGAEPITAAVSVSEPEIDVRSGELPETSEESGEITLQEYRELYREMMEVAEGPERALVQVIGITNEMDYFNQNYENQRRIAGVSVAMTDTELYILTEYRVVDKVERIQVVFYDGTMTDATFQKADQNTGLAVLKVPLKNIGQETREGLIVAPLGNSYRVERGEPVLALGSPLGFADSIAYGIVTSTSSKAPVVDAEYALLTTDIEGSADGSGVLIDLDGKVIGIITNSFGSSTGSITGLAISPLKELIEDLSNKEQRPYVGVRGQDVTQDITDRTGIPRGVLVTEVVQDSPAMLAGIKAYDVIVRIGDQSVDTIRGYRKALSMLEKDETVTITAMRRGTEGYAEMPFEVTIDSR